MKNQMLIVDSIESELIKAQGDKRHIKNKDEFDVLLNDFGSI